MGALAAGAEETGSAGGTLCGATSPERLQELLTDTYSPPGTRHCLCTLQRVERPVLITQQWGNSGRAAALRTLEFCGSYRVSWEASAGPDVALRGTGTQQGLSEIH